MAKTLFYAKRADDGEVGLVISSVLGHGFPEGTDFASDPTDALIRVAHEETDGDADYAKAQATVFEVTVDDDEVEGEIPHLVVGRKVEGREIRYAGLTPVDFTNETIADLALTEKWEGQVLSAVESQAFLLMHGAPVDDEGKVDPAEMEEWMRRKVEGGEDDSEETE